LLTCIPWRTPARMDIIASTLAKLGLWYQAQTRADLWWLALGLGGQLMFTGRWFVQWIASEKAKRSIVPETFWYFSFVGGLLVLAYGFRKGDPVIILGQFGVFIYGRNLYFLWKNKALGRDTGDGSA
jgi:lipid-A-disaccharide synthase-like uncharacterized protein